MALKKCRECRNEVSPKAETCPHCGIKLKERVWLGCLLFIAVLSAPFFPGFSLGVGVVLVASILAHLYVPPLRLGMGKFLRVSSDRPIRRVMKLMGFGFIAALLIFASVGTYSMQRRSDEAASQQAADDAVRAQADEAAKAQVLRLVDKAKTALAEGKLDGAVQALDEASKVKRARNRGLIVDLQASIKNSIDPAWVRHLLIGLPAAEFEAFRVEGQTPKSFSLGYAILTDRVVMTAKTQLETAAIERAENKKKADEKAAAEKLAEAAKAEAERLAAVRKADERKKAEAAAIQAAKPALEVESFEWSAGEYGNRFLKGVVVNNTGKSYRYASVQFNLYDASGAQVGSAIANVNNLEPHGKWKFEASVLQDTATKARLIGVNGY